MVFLKKIKSEWTPTEKKDLGVGDIWEFNGPYEQLVREGSALLVDKDGNEIELPGQTFECPVCFVKVVGLKEFTEHVSSHMPKPKVEEKVVEIKTEVKVEAKPEAKPKLSPEELRAKRLAALEKARAVRMAKGGK